MSILKMEKIKRIIMDYIIDERKTQAILLDGEWGCGKTFFVKNCLVPALENDEDIKVLCISLYGIDSVETIQNLVYSEWMKVYIGKHAKRVDAIYRILSNKTGVFGRSAMYSLEDRLLNKETIQSFTKAINEEKSAEEDKEFKIVVVFDDFERCSVDIVQLMGFLNNLTENNGLKLILIANEKEIDRQVNQSEEALKYIVALNDRIKDSNVASDSELSMDDLKKKTSSIFGDRRIYENTREKLIGLTVMYNVSPKESFDAVVDKYIRDESIKKDVIKRKETIVKVLEENNHYNLRTLISSFIATEAILSLIDDGEFDEDENRLLDEEINTIIQYSVYSSMRRAMGKPLFRWDNARYTCVNSSIWNPNRVKIYGYAFVDEYWKTQCADKTVILKDLRSRIRNRMDIEQAGKEAKEHENLALYKLSEWYYLEDERVKELVEQMKYELEQGKYKPYEFKNIVLLLMAINNPDFGMRYGESIRDSGGGVFDSTDDIQYSEMSVSENDEKFYNYKKWNPINIKEYVSLMVSYFNDKDFTLTNEMIRVLSEDKQFAFDYRMQVKPLIEMIEMHEFEMLSLDDDGISISDRKWNDELSAYFKKNRGIYMEKGVFFSLFEYDKLIEHISKASAEEIHCFCDAIREVYSFYNLSDYFSSDLDIVNRLIDYINKNDGITINQEKSRTKAIAVVKLKADLNTYSDSLSSDDVGA